MNANLAGLLFTMLGGFVQIMLFLYVLDAVRPDLKPLYIVSLVLLLIGAVLQRIR